MPKFPMKGRKFVKRGRKTARRGKKQIAITRIAQRTIPDKLMVKLPYTDLQVLGPQSLAVQKSYNVNGLYDPETGTLNDSNLGFAEYMRLFNRYRVYKVDYQVTLYNVSTDSAIAGSISFSEQGQQMVIGDVQQLQLPYSRRFTLAAQGNTGSMKTIKGSIFLPRVTGLTSEQYRTSDYFWGTSTSNPSTVLQMSINGINLNNQVNCGMQCDVRYTAHVELFERIDVLSTRPHVDG